MALKVPEFGGASVANRMAESFRLGATSESARSFFSLLSIQDTAIISFSVRRHIFCLQTTKSHFQFCRRLFPNLNL